LPVLALERHRYKAIFLAQGEATPAPRAVGGLASLKTRPHGGVEASLPGDSVDILDEIHHLTRAVGKVHACGEGSAPARNLPGTCQTPPRTYQTPAFRRPFASREKPIACPNPARILREPAKTCPSPASDRINGD